MTWQSCLFIFDTDSIGKKNSKKTPLLSWVQILQIFSVCPGVKSRTTRMRSGNLCILIDCFYWGSCNYRRMPSIRFLQLAGYWTISLLQLSLMLFVNERNEAYSYRRKEIFMFLISSGHFNLKPITMCIE